MKRGMWYRIQADFMNTLPGGMQISVNGVPSRDVMSGEGDARLDAPGDGTHLPLFRLRSGLDGIPFDNAHW